MLDHAGRFEAVPLVQHLAPRDRRLANVLPDSHVVVMEGQGHAAMLTAPALFVKAVEAFLLAS